jgi:sugar phosphate permease
MNRNFIKKYGTLLLLATGAGIIFQIPYIRETFYIPIQEGMNLTNKQMGMLNSGYSTMALASYFIGGLIADKFSAKKLLTFSFIVTGLLGLWFAQFPSYNTCRLIFVLLGISTIITYWSACIKATRMLGDSSEQGRLFGLQEGLRGVTNAILVFVMMMAYNHFADKVIGTQWAIRICALVVMGIGVLNWFFIDDTPPEAQSSSVKEVALGMWEAIKMPRVWILCGIVFSAYSLYGILGYLNTYISKIYGAPVEVAVTLGGVRYIIQAIGGITGGFLADKIGSKVKVIVTASLLLAISFMSYIFLPISNPLIPVIITNFILGLLLIYIIRSLYFAIIDDANIPVDKTGRVSGFVSFLGYSPDIFMYVMIGAWLDKYPGKEGFNRMFIYASVMSLLCVVFALILGSIRKKDALKAGNI